MREIIKLGKQKPGPEDLKHLKKVIWTNRLFYTLGYSLAWIFPNPISMFLIGVSVTGRWIVAHHVLHKAYDSISKRYNSKVFAQGWRRYFQWLDWIYPPAWHKEHNILHHFYTNETKDPDQLIYHEKKSGPAWLKVLFWKPYYYATNTLYTINGTMKDVILKCYVPYISFYYLLIPLLFIPLGLKASLFVLINTLGAEIVANLHSFLIIAPSHTADDLKLQEDHFKGREGFMKQQLESTCNYNTGGFWKDYFHGYLNYQIEHHLFPTMTMLQYTKIQPKLKELCGNKYIQESVFIRLRKFIRRLK